MKYVLCDGTPMLRLPNGTGLSREDCLHWSKLLRKAAAALKRPAFQSVSHVRVDGLTVKVKMFRDNMCPTVRTNRAWTAVGRDCCTICPPSPRTMGRDCSHGWRNNPKTISRTGS